MNPLNNPVRGYQKLKQLGKITVPYGGKTTQEGFHPGVDIANKTGTPIPNVGNTGKVVSVDTGHKQGENNWGNSVIIRDDQGNQQRYSHLHQAYVAPGQRVHSGQPIGTMGSSGATYSPSGGDPTNLDYRVSNAYGKYINPLKYINNQR